MAARESEREKKKRKKSERGAIYMPIYVAHIPPLEGWYSRDSLCYVVVVGWGRV